MNDNESIIAANTIPSAPADHHEFPPSGLNRMAACPASYKVCRGWSSPSSANSERGTLMHRAVYDDKAYASLSPEDRGQVDYIRQAHVAPYPESQGFSIYHELRLELRDENGDEINFGTCDIVILDATKTVAMVKDWKFGNVPVPPASRNLQLVDYSVGVMQMFPSVNVVFAEVVQPALEYEDQDAEAANDKVAEFTRMDMKNLLDAIRLVIRRCEEADLTNPSSYSCQPENCRYCNRLGCAEHRRRMEQNFALFGVEGNDVTAFLSTDEGKMTVEYANAVRLAKAAVDDAMKDKDALATKVILAAGGSADFKVVNGRTSRSTNWKKIAETMAIPQEIIDLNTTSKTSDPYLIQRQRRQRIPASVANAMLKQ